LNLHGCDYLPNKAGHFKAGAVSVHLSPPHRITALYPIHRINILRNCLALAKRLGSIASMKSNMTPDEQNDAIRDQVNRELPRPAGGFETDTQEQEWKVKQDARFFELCGQVKA
jgi:hypothetical protein